MNGIIGRKVGMTQIFNDKGDEVPVTVIEAGPCPVVQIKTVEKDGYSAVQIGFDPIEKKDKRKVAKPQREHFAKANVKPQRYLREFPLDSGDEVKEGDSVTTSVFEGVDFVSVTGISKGRGFAGVFKRYGFGGAPATRGSHEHFRHPGSIGMCEYPGRVMAGTKLPGHFGAETVKTLNLHIEKTYPEKNLILVRGGIPGPNGGVVIIERSDRKKKRVAGETKAKFVNPLKASKRGGR